MDKTTYKLIMEGIKKDSAEFDIPEIDKKLEKEYGAKQYVGTAEMQEKARKKDEKMMAAKRKRMIAERIRKREVIGFKDFGGKEKIEKDLNINQKATSSKTQSSIQKTQKEQMKKAKEVNQNQTSPKRPQEKSSTRGASEQNRVDELKSKWKTSQKGRAKGAFKAKTTSKSKEGKTK